jgi:hypothetical protein
LDETEKFHISLNKRRAKLGLLVALVGIASVAAYVYSGSETSYEDSTQFSNVVPANIEEVYPLFMCPCCGTPLDPSNICCGLAKERIDYISALSDAGISNEEIVLTTVKKYGINMLINESMKDEVRKELVKRAPQDRPKIEITPTIYDFGDVSVGEGIVKTIMTVSNNGQTDLVIDNMETSCMCTTAILTVAGKESPVFGMNMNDGKHPTGWSASIPPGDSATLTIRYDPQMHPDMRGSLTRTISVYSNDPVEFQRDVRIEANQIE